MSDLLEFVTFVAVFVYVVGALTWVGIAMMDLASARYALRGSYPREGDAVDLLRAKRKLRRTLIWPIEVAREQRLKRAEDDVILREMWEKRRG